MTEEEKEVRRIKRKARYAANREAEVEAKRLWRKNNPERSIEVNQKYEASKNGWYVKLKDTLSCEHCGEGHSSCIDFHHKDPKNKKIGIADALRLRWPEEKVREEIAKCMVLCANCHRKLHKELREQKNRNKLQLSLNF